ncbi:leucine-rich repeat domain-containing protein [Listeria monocytogenes]|nr:leucine-rich repeat domain-containing protein [Listeria monocytogenes]
MSYLRNSKQEKNRWMWKKGKQWICGSALFLTVMSFSTEEILATEMDAADSQVIGASESGEALPENVVETEEEKGATEEEEIVSGETPSPKPKEEKASPAVKSNNGTTVKEKKETTSKPKTGRDWSNWDGVTPMPISELFPDPELARKVQWALYLESVDDEITQSDLELIESIDLIGLRDTTGLERLTNLTSLWISGEGNLYLDANVVAGMSRLENLGLDGCNIEDVGPLANLGNLTTLSLNGNQINDVGPLANLTNLTHLGLTWNQISDLTPLAGLTQLVDLDLSNNQISDVSPLADLTNIRYLDVSFNQISDISSLMAIASNMGDSPYHHIYANYQEIRHPAINWSEVIKVPNIITNVDGNLVEPHTFYPFGGRYEEAELVWEGLPNDYEILVYIWEIDSDSPYVSFSGEAHIEVVPIDEPGGTGPGEGSTGGSGSEEGNTDGTDPGEGSTGESGSEEGNADGTDPGEGSTGESGSEEGNTNRTGPGEGNTDKSGSRERSASRLGSVDRGADKLDSKGSGVNNERKNSSSKLPKMQEQKLAKTGDASMMPLQGAGLLAFLSGIWVWIRRKKIK